MKKKIFEVTSHRWMNEKRPKVKASTFAHYEYMMRRHIVPFFGPMVKMRNRDVRRFVNKKVKCGMSTKTIKNMTIVLKMAWEKHCRVNRLRDCIDWKGLVPCNYVEKSLPVLKVDDERRFIEYIKAHPTRKNVGLLLCVNTGLRIGELCGLKWGDVDWENRCIRVSRTVSRIYTPSLPGQARHTQVVVTAPKTPKSVREVPLTEDMTDLLSTFGKETTRDFFILTGKLKPLEPRTYRYHYSKLMDELGIRNIRFHGLRHTFATRCIESKCDYKTVSDILGHANIATTLNLYVHPGREQKRQCISQMLEYVTSDE